MISVGWLSDLNASQLRVALLEYRHLVRRFPQWIALLIGRSDDEEIRNLLLPNLVREAGSLGQEVSHVKLLEACLASCGIDVSAGYSASEVTERTELWFHTVFASRPIHAGLCVLGPGTEAVSDSFLLPMERGVRACYVNAPVDLRYFDVHRAEFECEDARAVAAALARAERNMLPAEVEKARAVWVGEAIAHHVAFWNAVKKQGGNPPV